MEEEVEVSAAKECCRDREQRRRELLAERNALREELQTARRELAEKDRQVGAWSAVICRGPPAYSDTPSQAESFLGAIHI